MPSEAGGRVSALGLEGQARAGLRAGGPQAWSHALQVFTGKEPPARQPAIAGEYVLDDEGLHFTPRFAFVPGLDYVARFAAGRETLERGFQVLAPAGAAPRVLAVYPSGPELPENTLRLYVQFSEPMLGRGVHRHVRLYDEQGQVELPFVEIEQGLWDPRQTRLTLVFHPGRVKRGVAPGERMGPPLRAGHAYRLELDGELQALAGRPLGAAFEWRFRAIAADRSSPRLAELRVRPPSDALGALEVELPEPLDQALLQRFLWIEDPAGARLEGSPSVSAHETRWRFEPARPWRPGRHALRLQPALEDRAGNRFDRLFDSEGYAPAAAAPAPVTPLSLPFEVPETSR